MTTQEEIILGTEVCKNLDEQKFEDEFSVQGYECSHLFVPENCLKNYRKILTSEAINEIRNEIQETKFLNRNKIVIGFFQTKKNTSKSKEVVKSQMMCSIFESSDGACIYETDIRQNVEGFSAELTEFIGLTGNLDKYMVFEIESKEIRKKLEVSIDNGLRNFIIIAGKYSDNDLWSDIMLRVRAEEGKAIVILPKRMHKITKKSYMQQAIDCGATVVCHGKWTGGSSKDNQRINLYLDGNDMTYKIRENLPMTNILRNNRLFNQLMEANEGQTKKEYHISRLSALYEGGIYSNAHKRAVIVETSE